MIECSSCKKDFDYEKYYGICPKCGTYNPRTASNPRTISNPRTANNSSTASQSSRVQQVTEKKKGMSRGVRWFFVLILSGGIGLTSGWLTVALKELLKEQVTVEDQDFKFLEETDDLYCKELTGEPFELPVIDGSITVKNAKTKIPAGSGMEGFPQKEKLVAVEVSYSFDKEGELYGDCDPIGQPYVRYVDAYGQFVCKEAIPDYSFEDRADENDYGNILSDSDLFWIPKENETGVFLFFVDEEVSEMDFCISEWDVDKEELTAIHDVFLEINEEE